MGLFSRTKTKPAGTFSNPREEKELLDLTRELKLLRHRKATDKDNFVQKEYDLKLDRLKYLEGKYPHKVDPESPTNIVEKPEKPVEKPVLIKPVVDRPSIVPPQNNIPKAKEKQEGMFSSFFGPRRGDPISHRSVKDLYILQTEFPTWAKNALKLDDDADLEKAMQLLLGDNWKKFQIKYIPELLRIRTCSRVSLTNHVLFDEIGLRSIFSFLDSLSLPQKTFLKNFGFLPYNKKTFKSLDNNDLDNFKDSYRKTQEAINNIKDVASKISYCYSSEERKRYNAEHFDNNKVNSKEEARELIEEVKAMFNDVRNKKASDGRSRENDLSSLPSKTLKERYTKEEIEEIRALNREKAPVAPKVLSDEEKKEIAETLIKCESTLLKYSSFFSKTDEFESTKMMWIACETNLLRAISQ